MNTNISKVETQQAPDPIMAEVRRAKIKLVERYNYDLDAMVRDARMRQAQSGHEVVDRSTTPQ